MSVYGGEGGGTAVFSSEHADYAVRMKMPKVEMNDCEFARLHLPDYPSTDRWTPGISYIISLRDEREALTDPDLRPLFIEFWHTVIIVKAFDARGQGYEPVVRTAPVWSLFDIGFSWDDFYTSFYVPEAVSRSIEYDTPVCGECVSILSGKPYSDRDKEAYPSLGPDEKVLCEGCKRRVKAHVGRFFPDSVYFKVPGSENDYTVYKTKEPAGLQQLIETVTTADTLTAS
jgi:hypothetical protein